MRPIVTPLLEPRMFNRLKTQFMLKADATRRQAMADAYQPIIRGFLLPGSAYYLFVTWGHWKDETGLHFLILAGLSLATALLYHAFRTILLSNEGTSLGRLEAVGLATNLVMYANVLVYMLIHFEAEKLVYFVLMAVVFSTTGVTLRGTLASVALSIGTLLVLSHQASPERFNQFAFIGVATSFAALGMASLLRKAILRQIDARLRADDMAFRDSLTGIRNRRWAFRRMEALESGSAPFWLGIIDLDGFKSINDIYGHAVGDEILREVVCRLEQSCSEQVTLARIGGDEFLVLIAGDAEAGKVGEIGNAIAADINAPYQISSHHLTISATLGFAHFPSMASTARSTYEKADFALYRGKQHMRGRTIVFSSDQDREMRENLELERGLREADLKSELHVMFQPQMDVTRNAVVGFEALARWNSPTMGSVRPDKFIRAAERAGLIQDITKVLFRKGLDSLAAWPPDVKLSFNLSAQDVADATFVFMLVAEVLKRRIDPARIEFEITETAVMKDIDASRALLRDLSSARFRIALDDFGSGHSSFEYIDQLPLDKIKVDKSFVRRIAVSPPAREIIAGVLTLCRNLELDCVLEGVETEAELALLAPLGPQIIQGYLFGRPMDAAAVLELLGERIAHRPVHEQR
jgi:diguanylate cyclase (GGDEF)-like protein